MPQISLRFEYDTEITPDESMKQIISLAESMLNWILVVFCQCGVVWCGVLCGVVWCGVVWCGVVCGVVWFGGMFFIWYSVVCTVVC